ncbi:MAG TPA: M20/M25/M40 family metallo-hydrolase [Fimbriimonadaceae bacterium]|nr:M20/M25/M40 family metallo-hydrolase [Fimbriimonadaceae bacterium]
MSNSIRSTTLVLALAATCGTLAQTPDPAVMARIRDEGMNHSQVMKTLSYLSDVIGPRLTGSPSLKRANEWTRDTLTSWGLKNARLEAWGPFGRGWQLDRFSCQVSAPQDIPLIAYPKAWSPSLRGPVTADVVLIDVKDAAELQKFKGQLKGKIVMSGGEQPLAAHFTPQGTRFTDEQLLAMAEAQAQAPGRGGGGGGAGGGQGRRAGAGGQGGQGAQGQRGGAGGQGQRPGQFRGPNLSGAILRLAMDEGAIAVIDGSRGDDGTIFVQSAAVPPPAVNPSMAAPAREAGAASGTAPASGAQPPRRGPSVWDKSAPKTLPQVTVSSEQYNRMARMIGFGEKLKISLDLKTEFFDRDPMAYNTVAEIPGTDLHDQIVMVGGHMDSWHSGTGATDNGAGVAVAMEAVRILQALNLQPRRTIRVALWSGEEEGLFGSRNYVAQHFGSYASNPPSAAFGGGGGAATRGPLTKGADYDKISAYFNLDNGTGKIRGIYCQGNTAVESIFADWLKPFADLGAGTITIRNTGSTDHVSFDAIGIPGFQFIQDVIEYNTRTHHSNQDVFDRVQGDDLKQAAVIEAAFLYNTAMRDEMLPRKPAQGD